MKRGDSVLYAVLGAIFAASCLASGVFLFSGREGGDLVLEIISGGTLLESLDLSALEEDGVLELHGGGGSNVLSFGPGGAKMISADCRGGDCLRMPAIRGDGGTIACLPHRLIVRIRQRGAQAGIDSVTY
ncbi:MAG: NusG domain II-containing protein [Synergistaceae bacterium]|nr:NusG domain II-containing protein [Synergistaceae bacterium]